MNGFRPLQTKSLVKFMGHSCALLLSGSDIRFLGTTGPEPEPDIQYIPIRNFFRAATARITNYDATNKERKSCVSHYFLQSFQINGLLNVICGHRSSHFTNKLEMSRKRCTKETPLSQTVKYICLFTTNVVRI